MPGKMNWNKFICKQLEVVSSFKINSTAVTATAAELNTVAGVTAGTVSASKALVAGSGSTVAFGTLTSADDTHGVHLTATVNKVVGIHADTGGAALTTGNVRAGLSRMLVGTAPTAGQDISIYGHEALLKTIANMNTGGNQAGVLGHLESAGAITITGTKNTVRAGVASYIDLDKDNSIVAANTVISAFGVNPAALGKTMNGRTSIIHVTNPASGSWGSFLELSDNTGVTQANAAGSTPGPFLKLYINGTLYTIATATA